MSEDTERPDEELTTTDRNVAGMRVLPTGEDQREDTWS